MKILTERPYLKLFAILALLGFAADQTTKYVVFAKLYPSEATQTVGRLEVIPGLFDLQAGYQDEGDTGAEPLSFLRTIGGARLPHLNRGALFGIGNSGEGLNNVFAGISVAAAGFIVFWVRRPNIAQDRWLCIALGLILAGTVGNLYDRLVFGGVRDFLHCYYVTTDPDGKPIPHIWPDFNIADCCLVCGAGVLLVHSFFVKEPTADAAKTEPAVAAASPMQTTAPTSGA